MAALGAAGLRAALLLGGGSVAVAGAVAGWAVFAPVKTLTLPDQGVEVASTASDPAPSTPDAPPVTEAAATTAGSAPSADAVPDAAIAPVAAPAAEPNALDATDPPISDIAMPEPATPPASAPEVTATLSESAPADAAAQPQAATDGAAAPSPDASPLASPPAFDVVRVEPDGAALIAGRASPGATVGILVDGAEVAQAEADASGRFVALLDLPASGAPRLLTLLATGAVGEPLPGTERVALAPTEPMPGAADVAVASVAPKPRPAGSDTVAEVSDRAQDPPAALANGGDGVATDAAAFAASGSSPDPSAAPDLLSPPTAPAPPVALLLSDGGVRILQDAPTLTAVDAPIAGSTATSDVSIDVISYTAGGEVLLSGRAGPGVVRLYLDNRAVQDVTVDRGAWTAQLAETAPGLYTLRADGLAADGSVAARFETPFKRETRAALASVLGGKSLTASAGTVRIAGTDVDAVTTPGAGASDLANGGTLADGTGRASDAKVSGDGGSVASTSSGTSPANGSVAVTAVPAGTEGQAPANPAAPVPQAPDASVAALSVTVQPGFTLWGIAEDRFGSGMMYVQVFEANRGAIRNPDLIYPGQVFALPNEG